MTIPTSNNPAGWSYNPSAWSERLWIVSVAGIGFLVSGYMALYQIGVVQQVWEPLLGLGSQTVLNSFLSHLLPVPDAALGAFAYALDAATGAIGGQARWRTMPWMVILFGLAVGPLGLVSVLLVISQPMLLNAWCTLCLFSAFISLIMIGPTMDEVLASLQFLRRTRERSDSVWTAFWHGGEDRDVYPLEAVLEGERETPPVRPAARRQKGSADFTVGKTSLPWEGIWNHLLIVFLGAWLMAAPDVMEYEGPERIVDHLVGPLVVSAAIIAMAEATRAVRWINVMLGIWLMLAPVLTGYEPLHIGARSALIGATIFILSIFFGGPNREQIGGGWRRLWATPVHTSSSQRQVQQWKNVG